METILKYDKRVKVFNTVKNPRRQSIWSIWLIGCLSKLFLLKQKRKLEKFNMEGLKPPYLMLCNHNQFMDFEVAALATFPRRMNNVASLDAYTVWPWLIRNIGTIPKRKFNRDTALIKQIKYTLTEYKNITTIYPEARYGPIGTTAKLPDSLFKMIKMLGMPVVVFKMQGHHLQKPNWTLKRRKVPIYASMTQVLTKDDIKNKDSTEIKQIVTDAFEYNDYDYQLKNNIQITEPDRAEGLEKVLYQCKACGKEFSITSKGAKISCSDCGKVWELRADGRLQDADGKFENVPDWYEWQRGQVRKQILDGSYSFEEQDIMMHSMPHPKKMIPIGKVSFRHDNNGLKVKGNYNGQDFEIVKEPLENYAAHIEYATPFLKRSDIISFSDKNDSYFFVSKNPNTIQKLSLAVEELYEFIRAKALVGVKLGVKNKA